MKEVTKAEKADLELELKLGKLKEYGNLHFRKKAYKDAIKQFSEAINLFNAAGKPMGNEDIKTKVIQLYTNRSLAFSYINQQASALGDANIVLNEFDAKNQKALMRRRYAYKI